MELTGSRGHPGDPDMILGSPENSRAKTEGTGGGEGQTGLRSPLPMRQLAGHLLNLKHTPTPREEKQAHH